MSKHLTLTDRAIIEKYLALDMSFTYIARRPDRSATTISREVKNHRCFVNGIRYTSNDCANHRTCLRRNLCSTESKYSCFSRCKTRTNTPAMIYARNTFHFIVPCWTNRPMYVPAALRKNL